MDTNSKLFLLYFLELTQDSIFLMTVTHV